MQFHRTVGILIILAASSLPVGGCDTPGSPSPSTDANLVVSTALPPDLLAFQGLLRGDWNWHWRPVSEATAAARPATLHIEFDRADWTLARADSGAPAAGDTLILEALDTASWHSMSVVVPAPGQASDWVPLRRLASASTVYSDLLEVLQDLTESRFEQIVTHWRQYPVPVRAAPSWTGGLDLAECLHEAVDIWNEGQPLPPFRWDPQASWGARLVHYPGVHQDPVLYVQATRLEDDGRPLVLQIRGGDNYSAAHVRRYAVRAFVHELGHCCFLWGHTRDRIHILWGSAPPLVDGPSLDERRCLRLWRLLPDGLDLSRYGRK